MKSLIPFLLVIALVAVPVFCSASPSYLVDPPVAPAFDPTAYSKILFIHVVFPDTMPDPGYMDDIHLSTVPQGFVQHLKWQSQGTRDYDEEVLINPLRGDGLWVADYPVTKYARADSVDTIARYSSYWECWNYGNFCHAGELQVEILYEIWDSYCSYYGVGNFDNPFEGAAAIVFLLRGKALHATEWGGYGGFGATFVGSSGIRVGNIAEHAVL